MKMKHLFHVVLCNLFVYFPGTWTIPHKAVSEPKWDIVGGHIAKRGEFPYQVSLRWKRVIGEHFCGGAILNKNHIVTAAHCGIVMLRRGVSLNEFYIGAGVTNKSDVNRMIKREIESVTPHEEYDKVTLRNDICIIKIKGHYKFNKLVRPLRVNSQSVKEGKKCTISGWGLWHEGDYHLPDPLKGAYVPISNQRQCVANYTDIQRIDLNTMLCAGYPNGGTDSCSGDSGGPLVCDKKLTGIVSFGMGCAEPDYPGVYARVKEYMKWIAEHVADGGKHSSVV